MAPRFASHTSSGHETAPLFMPGCETFQQCSHVNGLAYEIFVSVPDCPAPPSGFPVIYVLDGNAEFITISETMKRVSRRSKTTGIMPAVVVGIGYPNTEGYNLDRRYRDFTRGLPADDVFTDVTVEGCGGQADYIAFLRDDLLPHINMRFPVDPVDTTIVGHSLAGYFVLDLLVRDPNMFSSYVSFSPSVWWDRASLIAQIAGMTSPSRLVRVYTAVGEREQEMLQSDAAEGEESAYSELRRSRRMIDNAREATAAIENSLAEKVLVKFDVGVDEDHATIVPAMLCRALRFVVGVSS